MMYLILVLAAGLSQPFQVAMHTKLRESIRSPWLGRRCLSGRC